MTYPTLLLYEVYQVLSPPLSQFSFTVPGRLAGQRLLSVFPDKQTEG